MKILNSSSRSLLLSSALLSLAACGGSSDSSGGNNPSLTVNISPLSVAFTAQSRFDGNWAAFTADEATSGAGGSMLNTDADVFDSVVQVLNLTTGIEMNTEVAARDFEILGDTLYMSVDEALDGFDWDMDGTPDERVLVAYDLTTMTGGVYLTLLREDTGDDLVRTDDWLFISRNEGALMANTSSVWGLHSSTPNTLHQVMTNDATAGLVPNLLGSEDGLVFLSLDETREARDLNGDSDSMDENVLALLDGRGTVVVGGYEFPLRNAERAMPDAIAARRALSTGTHDWQVGFVVDETDQDDSNLNNHLSAAAMLSASWQPTHCVGEEDVDTVDTILTLIDFRAWDDDPVTSPPVNTGLIAYDRIVMQPGWVGTVSEESQQGTCDLNGDGDTDDLVFRWTAVTSPILPPGTVNNYYAVGDDMTPPIAGGLQGTGELGNAFVLAVDEAADRRDLNDDGFQDLAVLLWLDPAAGVVWTNDHGSSAASYAAASWMGPSSDKTRLGIAYDELSNGVDLNNDGDQADSVATFAQFVGAPQRLAFPGYAAAVQKENAGITFQNGWAFFRVSEAKDTRDWNNDGTADDFVMLRARLADGLSQYIIELNAIPGRMAVEPDLITGASGGTFLVDESMAGDLNADGVISFAIVFYAI
jgi:hypothetical protein